MAQIDTSNLDAGTDKIKLARPAILAMAQLWNKLFGYTTDDITATEKTAARTVLDVPTKGGSGASGTWGISISGNAASATTAGTVSDGAISTAKFAAGAKAPLAGTADAVPWTGVSGRPTALSAFSNDVGYITSAPAPNTTNVLAATAGASVGAVGTYAFLGVAIDNTGVISAGGTLAGSSLRYLGIVTSDDKWSTGGTKPISGTASGTPSGTWRAMGYVNSGLSLGGPWGASLWLRIS